MKLSSPDTLTGPQGFDIEHDRDLIAMMNEARSDHELQTHVRAARARLGRRQAGGATGNRRTIRRAIAAPLSSLARAIEGPERKLESIKH